MDPLARNFADLTPYQFAGNTPIRAIDIDGLEPWDVNGITIYGPWANTDAASQSLHADQLAQLNDLLSNNQNLSINNSDNSGYGEFEINTESETQGTSTVIKVITKRGLGIVSLLLMPANGQQGYCQGIPAEYCPAVQENIRYYQSFQGSLERLYRGADLFTNPENWHHVISQKFRPGKNGNHTIVEAAINGGFDFDAALTFDGNGNTVPLEAFRKKNGEGQHNGGHPKYNKLIKSKLDDFEDNVWDDSNESAKNFLEELVKDAVKAIPTNPSKKLDEIDF